MSCVCGRPYAPIDASLPDKRIEKILENLMPRAIVADRESLGHAREIVAELSKDENFVAPEIFVAEEVCSTDTENKEDEELFSCCKKNRCR